MLHFLVAMLRQGKHQQEYAICIFEFGIKSSAKLLLFKVEGAKVLLRQCLSLQTTFGTFCGNGGANAVSQLFFVIQGF